MPTLILLHRQIYQAPESVVMKHRVHYRPTILFLTHQSNVIDCSLPLARNHISKNVKPCSYVHKKNQHKIGQPHIRSFRNLLLYFSLSGSFRFFFLSFYYFFFIYLYFTLRPSGLQEQQKNWFPTYTAVVAHLTTIAQPFPIFRKLLATIPSMNNHPRLIILNQKINTDTKSPMLLTQLVL